MARRRYRRNPDINSTTVIIGLGVLGLVVYLISSSSSGDTSGGIPSELNTLLQQGDGNLPAGTVLPGGSVVLQ